MPISTSRRASNQNKIHDLSGGYNRFDIFKLSVDRSSNRPILFVDTGAAGRSVDPHPGDEDKQSSPEHG